LEFYDHVTSAGIVSLARGCRELKTLVIVGIDTVDDAALLAVAENRKQLESLQLSGTAATDVSISAVVRECPLLSTLLLANCDELTNASAIAIAQHCTRNLKYLLHLWLQRHRCAGKGDTSTGAARMPDYI